MDPILHKFRDKFFEEATGLLDRLEKDLLELEISPDNKELIESAFRAMHTIKGVSGMYGFEYISEFTHSMENIYQAIRDEKLTFNKEISNLTFLSIDHIRKLLQDEGLTDVDNLSNHNLLLTDINTLINNNQEAKPKESIQPKAGKPSKSSWHIMLRANEKLYFRGISLLNIFRELAQLGEFQITRIEYLSDAESDTWSILLNTDADSGQIFEVFLFIEDDVIVTKLSEENIFETTFYETQHHLEEIEHEPSILDYIEGSAKTKDTPAHPSSPKKAGEKKISQAKDQANIKRISVDSMKLDNLMYLVSELITVNSQLLQSTAHIHNDIIRQNVERLDNLSKQFRNTTLEIRLVPLSDTILRFQRLIRDLSHQLNKKVELVTHGIETELDKNTIDQLNEPLMHIIRNCIDHGIEFPDQRLKKGKSETGIIKISAFHSGNYVVIKVEDDGTGINIEKVRQKAVDKGIIKASDKPEKKDLFNMIFLPGFSTARSLTEVSGRGVGLDVVKRKIIDLRGNVFIESEENKGTSFTLKLQQSVAIIDTLLFSVENSFFTVPISDINICSQLSAKEIEKRKHTATIPFNDVLIPFIDLRQTLNIQGTYNEKIKAVILRNNDRQVAILTDKIVGEHQAVLKPLGKSFKDQNIISSASQLGDGNLAFMIDTNELFKMTMHDTEINHAIVN
ncbi:MAG TPA: chemotaxis protein CheA [Bacteroidales bacterium]|nr:chemotaxis protein CheA [Bacteroidales bacterium]